LAGECLEQRGLHVNQDRAAALDQATVRVEVSEAIFFDEMRRQSGLKEAIKRRLEAELGLSLEVKLVEKRTLEPSEGQPGHVLDRRKP